MDYKPGDSLICKKHGMSLLIVVTSIVTGTENEPKINGYIEGSKKPVTIPRKDVVVNLGFQKKNVYNMFDSKYDHLRGRSSYNIKLQERRKRILWDGSASCKSKRKGA